MMMYCACHSAYMMMYCARVQCRCVLCVCSMPVCFAEADVDENQLMGEWFNLVHEKNALVRYESELMVRWVVCSIDVMVLI